MDASGDSPRDGATTRPLSVIPLAPASPWYGPAISLPLVWATPFALMFVFLGSSGMSRVIGCLVIAAVAGAVIAGLLKQRRGARIELWPDHMRIHQPALLRAPLDIPREQVRAVTFDNRRGIHRFAVLNDFVWGAQDFTHSRTGWLFESGKESILPYLGPQHATPNTAIVVETALSPVPRHRRLTRLNESNLFPGVSRPTHGFFARARRPSAARHALDGWTQIRDLVDADVTHLLNVPPEAPVQHAAEPTNPYGIVDPSRGARLGRHLNSAAEDVDRFLTIFPCVAFATILAGVPLVMLMLMAITWWSTAWPILVCVLLYVAIIAGRALVPRGLGITPIGVPLPSSTYPRVTALVREAADIAEGTMVDEIRVTLMWDVAVRVINRRRILFIGVPLMGALDQRTLTGRIAREFLRHDMEPASAQGPDGYLPRVMNQLELSQIGANRLNPNRWIARGAVHLVSLTVRAAAWRPARRLKARVVAADATVADAVGADAFTDDLMTFAPLGDAFDVFMNQWYLPALQSGYAPPLTDGFRRFVAQPAVATSVAEMVPRVIRDDASHESRQYLPLYRRITALDTPRSAREIPVGLWTDEPTVDLLPDLDLIESTLIEDLYLLDEVRPTPLAWEDLIERVWAPQWHAALVPFRSKLCWFVVEDLVYLAKDPVFLASLLGADDTTVLPTQTTRSGADNVLGCLLAVALVQAGVRVTVEPGGEVIAIAGERELDVFAVTGALGRRTITAVGWRRRCAEMDIARVRVAPVPPPTHVGPGSGLPHGADGGQDGTATDMVHQATVPA